MGSGHKHEDKDYYPVHPPMVQCDPDEKPVYGEPNPPVKNAKDVSEDLIAKAIDKLWA